eukprot:m.1002256 g.1002256  ORF g.1002256 m.1002256 type:complete len:103 (-) comp24035_c0_seq2:4476-4784(-)
MFKLETLMLGWNQPKRIECCCVECAVFMIFMKWLVRSCGDASSADSKEMFAKNAEVLLWLLGATKERLEEPLGATSPLLENLVVEATALWQRGLTDDGVSYV